MATIGLDKLFYSKITENENGEETYATPVPLAKAMTAELSIYETFIDAGIPHYTGADSFALNGAFVGYGVDYANLGQKTADMIADILMNDADPATTPVETFDNGTATINTETCEGLGLDLETIKKDFEPLCTQVNETVTAESFDEVEE